MQKKIDRKSPPAWATERALMPGDLLILHRYLFLQAYLASLCELQNERRKLRDILDSTKSTSQRFGLEGDEYDALFNHYRHERMSCLRVALRVPGKSSLAFRISIAIVVIFFFFGVLWVTVIR